jgi:hypothetical protein
MSPKVAGTTQVLAPVGIQPCDEEIESGDPDPLGSCPVGGGSVSCYGGCVEPTAATAATTAASSPTASPAAFASGPSAAPAAGSALAASTTPEPDACTSAIACPYSASTCTAATTGDDLRGLTSSRFAACESGRALITALVPGRFRTDATSKPALVGRPALACAEARQLRQLPGERHDTENR